MIHTRLKMVLTQNELDKVNVFENRRGKLLITADVHGMKCYEARRFINNIINIVRPPPFNSLSFMVINTGLLSRICSPETSVIPMFQKSTRIPITKV